MSPSNDRSGSGPGRGSNGSSPPAARPDVSKFTEDGVRDYERRRYRGIDQRIVHARETHLIRKCFGRICAAQGLPQGGAAVLDLPCGYGRFTDLLRAYAGRMVASDLSFEMVRRAVGRPGLSRELGRIEAGRKAAWGTDGDATGGGATAASAARPEGAVANAKQGLPFKSGAFDVVFSLRFFHHIHDPLDRARILGEFQRVTAGWAIVSFYRMNGLHGIQRRLRRKFHKSRTNIKMIEPGTFEKEAAAAGFEVVRVFPLFRGIHAYHLALLRIPKINSVTVT
jgi:SAM-dependent methyltransferase